MVSVLFSHVLSRLSSVKFQLESQNVMGGVNSGGSYSADLSVALELDCPALNLLYRVRLCVSC